MAPGSRLRRSPRRNPPANPADDELAGDPPGAPTESSGFPTPPSRRPLPALAPAPAHARDAQVGIYTDEDLQKATQNALDSFVQGQAQAQVAAAPAPATAQLELRERPRKARFPELYYGNSHKDCYDFRQQCEDYFETPRATGTNRVSFAASFLRGGMPQRWLQYKRRLLALSPDPPTWAQFKGFLRKNLEDSRVFIDDTWNRVRQAAQYQLEEVQDFAAHLEYLQSVLLEFDDGPDKSYLIRFFRDGLRPSIKVQMENDGQELLDWEDPVQKAIKAEAKTGLHPPSMLREMNQRVVRAKRPAESTEASSSYQEAPMKDPIVEEPRTGASTPGLFFQDPRAEESPKTRDLGDESSHYVEPSMQSEKVGKTSVKKSRRERKEQYRLQQARNSGTPTTDVNTVRNGGVRKDLSHITCFKCDKKGHYAGKCVELREDRDAAED